MALKIRELFAYARLRTWLAAIVALGLGIVASILGSGTAQASAYQYRPYELTFTSSSSYTNPFDVHVVDFSAVFTGPGGQTMNILGFWDGGQTWKIRFTPPQSGSWSYTTSCSNTADTGLHGISGSVNVQAASGPNPLYEHGGMLKTSSNNRYLTYQDGTPFFYLADTWWNAPSRKLPITRPSVSDIPAVIPQPFNYSVDKRVGQTYTVLQMHGSSGMFAADPDNARFIFSTTDNDGPGDIQYWQEYDKYYQYANDQGLVVNIGVAAHSTLDMYSLDELKRLYRYMLARHGAYAMMMLITQEYNAPVGDTAGRRDKVFALASYLRSIDAYQRLITLHMYPVTTPDSSWDESWNDYVMDQNGHFHTPRPKDYYYIYNRCQCLPLLESELNYEGFDNGTGTVVDAKMVRSSAYTAIQSGSFGFGYGASGTYTSAAKDADQNSAWGPVYKWWDALEFDGGAQMQWLRKAYESVEWWRLEPALSAIPSNGNLLVKADWVRTYLIWYPYNVSVSAGTLLKETAYDGAVYKSTWFNPRTGDSTSTADITVSGSDLTLPDRPDSQDWLLILQYKGGGKLPDKPTVAINESASWNFTSGTESWTAAHDISGFAWQSGGYAAGTITGDNPYLYSPDHVSLTAADSHIIKIGLKNVTGSTYGQLYFRTDDDTTWDEAKSIRFPLSANDTVYREYILDMSHIPAWKGTLRQLRLDPGDSAYGSPNGGSFSIDYVKLGERIAPSPPAVAWSFASDKEGWTSNVIGFAWQTGGYVGGTSNTDDPQTYSPNNLNIDISNNKYIKIRLKNGSTSTTGQLYFTTTTDTVFDSAKRKQFVLSTQDSDYQEYILDMTDMATWSGKLKQLRFDPGDARASGATNGLDFSIDYVSVQSCY